MNTEDLISVIIPVYNSEKYVRQTLDSIVNQTYKNLEILLIDDGSTDQSPAICEEYCVDNRVKVFHRQNAGVAASRQFGFDNSHGIYYVTIDSDDYVTEDFVEKLYKAIKKNDADISVCGVSCFVDGNPKITAAYMPTVSYEKLTLTKELLVTDFYKISCDLLLTDSWNKMYRAEFVRNTNVRYQLNNIYTGSELMYNHRLALHCPSYCVVPESLLFHRNHAGSRVSKKDKPMQEGFEIITESLIEESKEVGISVREQMSAVYYGLIGMVALDIYYYGGTIEEKHKKFQMMISRNRCFLQKHFIDFDREHLKVFYVSRFSLPSFMLSSALWLDAFFICYDLLRKVKYRVKSEK